MMFSLGKNEPIPGLILKDSPKERVHGLVILAPCQYNTCHNDTQHNNTEYHSSGCLYTKCDIFVPVWVSFFWVSLFWVLHCFSYADSHSFWVSLFWIVHCYSYAECHSSGCLYDKCCIVVPVWMSFFWVSLCSVLHCYPCAECCSIILILSVIILCLFMLSVALLFLYWMLHCYSYAECHS